MPSPGGRVGTRLRRLWPLAVTLILFWAAVAALLAFSLRLTEGHLVYPLDDPYISMAMARNFADGGVWGVTRHEFTSSSSSLLWPLLLAATDRITGSHDASPLVWNIVIATGLIVLADRLLRARGLAQGPLFVVLLAMTFLIPLPLVSLVGLEHTLHALLTIVVAYLLARQLSGDAARLPHLPSFPTCLTVVLLVMTRYEGLFLVLAGCLIAATRRRWLYAVVLGLVALLPVAAYGIVSVKNGWYVLPNSVLLKGNLTHTLAFLKQSAPFSVDFLRNLAKLFGVEAYRNIMFVPAVAFLPMLVLLPILLWPEAEEGVWETRRVLELLFLGTFLLHAQFGRTGWLFRYEAYLVGLAIFAAAWACRWAGGIAAWRSAQGGWIRVTAMILLLALPGAALAERAAVGMLHTVEGSKNIYEQQYQMGLFLRDHYQGEQVTAQDVGAINYMADIRCIDILGLASLEPVAMSASDTYEEHVVGRWSGGRGIAVLYKETLTRRGGVPPTWVEIGAWTIQHNVVCGGPTVTFYAVDPAQADALRANLRRFGTRLPPTVAQDISGGAPQAPGS
jgi:hypothetical protein